MTQSIGIAGAGLLGRLLAWRLSRAGHRVAVFDPAAGPEPGFDGRQAAGFSAAGMLSPLAELDCAGPALAALGWRSIGLWREIVAALPGAPMFARRGSLLLSHRSDLGAAKRMLARLQAAPAELGRPRPLDAAGLAALEPAVQGPAHAWLLPGEAQIDPVATLRALHAASDGVAWHWGCTVEALQPGRLRLAGAGSRRFDQVFDVRGTGAGRVEGSRANDAAVPATPGLPPAAAVHGDESGQPLHVRGVRGETVWLQAPGHGLQRPLRLLHPRHRIYLVPRPGDIVFVGASEIESEDRGPVSLRSAVELMAAAHSVMPALAEARILRLDRNLRPALPDNEPRIEHEEGLVRINGLFRHGWLLAPALVDDALARCHLAGLQEALPA